ncbi:hypothetical protein MHLP_03545 [Candidatus Mycoplasma haematolamae str. Purdue]|uniref:Uncharacterized protein n=1 Tax=Mycoplasma haematolamae (strain Purdue) TaxID=1212765 RepID=I7CK73_MYCHA|nr:hypothetical protein [Candidatus Mycoplasma haematolamae]AFO52289.1 hypothetical protein MHLP_03545 [Candidatus Mycoplasma haematolamae str. Purdue]
MKPILVRDNKKISEDVVLSLEKILDLQKKNSLDEAWDSLSGILDKVVQLKNPKVSIFQSYASGAGVKFAQAAWKEEWKPGKPVTPLAMIIRALRGREFSEVCKEDKLKKSYFEDECDKIINLDKNDKEIKVIDVLKSAYDSGSWYSPTWRVSKKGAGGSWSGQTQLSDYSATSDLKNKGYSNGLVAEQCPQLRHWLTSLQSAADQKVCEKILEGAFGDTVNQKRYCV